MTKSTKTTEQTKAPVAPKKKVFYAVSEHNPQEVESNELYPCETLEEAYKTFIEDMGADTKAHAYKIEFMGEVSMELKIKP